jgi:hypothetical protein
MIVARKIIAHCFRLARPRKIVAPDMTRFPGLALRKIIARIEIIGFSRWRGLCIIPGAALAVYERYAMTKPLPAQMIQERRSLPVVLAKYIAAAPLADQEANLRHSRLYQAMTPAAKLETLGALHEVRYKTRRTS